MPFATMSKQAADAFDAYRSRHHFANLDGLRCISICAVLWHHSTLPGLYKDVTLLSRGFLGVNLFFLISGFLITTLLLREESRTGGISLGRFYIRRALRILPPYLLLVGAVTLYYEIRGGEHDAFGLAPYYFAFLSNFLTQHLPLLEPTWSLSVEEQYYLIWPVVLSVIAGTKASARPAITIAAITLLTIHETGALAQWTPPPPATQHATFSLSGEGYCAILIGSLLAMAQHHRRPYEVLYKVFGHGWSLPICAAALAGIIAIAPPTLRGLPAFGIHLAMAALLCTLTLGTPQAGSRLLRVQPVVAIGKVSYGIYLYHMIGLHFANRAIDRIDVSVTASGWAVLCLYTLISIAIAVVSYRFLETPLLRLKDKLG